MKNIIIPTFCVTLIIFLILGGSPLSFAQDEHTVLLYTFETGAGKVVKDLSDSKTMVNSWDRNGVKETLVADLSSAEMVPGIL